MLEFYLVNFILMPNSKMLKVEDNLNTGLKAKDTQSVKNIISGSANSLEKVFEGIKFKIVDHEEDLEEILENIEFWDCPDILIFTQKQLLMNYKNELKNDYYCYISYDNMYFVLTKDMLKNFRTVWIKIKASYSSNWLRYYKIVDSWSKEKFQGFLDWLSI